MIQLLAAKYNKHIAYVLLLLFMSSLAPVYGRVGKLRLPATGNYYPLSRPAMIPPFAKPLAVVPKSIAPLAGHTPAAAPRGPRQVAIGGPTQPEMSSFQAAGANNMVNLFTGDFSYNIPLLDVGGYPVNIFYDGSVSMEQEASWVGLGWNVNPGNVNRNMRGIPDDFNGNDTLVTIQSMKPNKTWGIGLGADLEIAGVKDLPEWLSLSIGLNLGVSFNNYLGPALDLGIKGGANFKIAEKTKAEKSGDSATLKVGIGIAGNINSRYGLTLSPNVSLTASHFTSSRSISTGLSLGTSYNSRTGIKSLQISEQTSFNSKAFIRTEKNKKGVTYITDAMRSATYGARLAGVSISFAKPSYTPAIRMPLTNEAWSGHFQLGGGIWGVYGSAEAEVYGQISTIAKGDVEQRKPMVGYLYYENARGNPAAVMDFTRLNDREVTSNTPIISAPQYTYDVFSIQGEGTGGSIRAYRNDHGYVRDNYTGSRDKNLSIGADIGIPGHFGANVNSIKTPSSIGEWGQGNQLRDALTFTKSTGTWENVYFRNPGEVSVLHDQQFNKVSGADLVRFRLGGTKRNPTVDPVLERFSPSHELLGTVSMTSTTEPQERKKRTQVISMLSAADATKAALDTAIRNYDNQQVLDAAKNLVFSNIRRVSEYRKAHHISQIDVTEADGKRYVYGIPVYNIIQKDFSFSVYTATSDNAAQNEAELVPFNPSDTGRGSPLLDASSQVDGFLQVTRTPAYAHSFLLSGLLSPDYVDVTGNGITEDDLGGAVKFNYTKINAPHKWRTPLTNGMLANFNPGNLSVSKDNKGIIAYGERESWYLHSIESKTMIAFFILGNRADDKGAANELADINTGNPSTRRLDRIDLYNKADVKKNGIPGARPVKSVHFQYSYALCADAPGNNSNAESVDGQPVNTAKGKLTLDKIYFTYNGQSRASKNQYVFAYGSDTTQNPKYALGASDRWGSYKPRWMNPDNMKNADFPYTIQPKNNTDSIRVQQQAGSWALKKILLPSGGQLEVEYESDDYAFVQDRRASAMMQIVGFGTGSSALSNNLYQTYWPTGTGNNELAGLREHDRVYIKVSQPCNSKVEVFERYLRDGTPLGTNQLAFKLAINMPKGMEYVNSYATVADYGVHSVADSIIWVQLNKIDGISPLSLTALEYLREQLPGQAYPGYDVSESSGLKQLGEMMAGWGSAIKSAFRDPLKHLRSQGLAQTVLLARSFVRLNDPDGRKYGGGNRVRKVTMKDNWNAMSDQYTSLYGQQYDYTTSEVFQGQKRTISSGVASYEPGIGGDENPFQTIRQVANKLPMGPTSYGAIEMPVLDAFFPAPVVGYSKVTVRSLNKGVPAAKKSRSGVGRQVTEFYTAKDFPVYYNHTSIDPASDKQSHSTAFNAFFYKYAFDSRALSQGFIVATNDMHGKMRSQSSYAENDSTTRINYTENFYRNTGSRGLQEKFDFAWSSEGGLVKPGNMGVDIELMTDTREFSIKSSSMEIQAQLDLFPVVFPIWLPFIWPVFGNSENTYRAVTTTKLISYHAILDSVVVFDKGSQVSTKNLVYDAETGSLIVSRTNNEYDKPVYSVNYPAWWAYGGMGPAYKNIDAVYSQVNFADGKITSGNVPLSSLESGDELFIINPGSPPGDCPGRPISSDTIRKVWAFDKKKNSQSLTNLTPDYVFLDKAGRLYNRYGVTFRILRSGKRNHLGTTVAGVLLMTNPVSSSTGKLLVNNLSKVVNATALEFREKWQTDNDVIRKVNFLYDPYTCDSTEVIDCEGFLEKHINPYQKGLIGNFRPYRSLVFYGNRTIDTANLQFGTDVVKALSFPGGTHFKEFSLPTSAPAFAPTFTASNLGMNLNFASHNVVGQVTGGIVEYYVVYKTRQYTKITTPNTYNFTLTAVQTTAELASPDYFSRGTIAVTIKKAADADEGGGVEVFSTNSTVAASSTNSTVAAFSTNNSNSPENFSAFLTCDTYVIETLCSIELRKPYDNVTGFHQLIARFGYSSNTGTTSYKSLTPVLGCNYTTPIVGTDSMLNPTFSLPAGKKMLFSAWVKEPCGDPANGVPCNKSTYTNNSVKLQFDDAGNATDVTLTPTGPIIDGWQRVEGAFTVPATATSMTLQLINTGAKAYYDDIRIHPYNANMKTYVYDPVNLRLVAELDGNNYATFYEYDAEGGLIRTKAETNEGIKTIQETRSYKQKNVTTL